MLVNSCFTHSFGYVSFTKNISEGYLVIHCILVGFFPVPIENVYTHLEMSRLPMKHYKLRPKLGAKKEHSTFRDT